MKWTRKRKMLSVVAIVALLLFGADFCRVQISLTRIIDRAKLGDNIDTTETKLGKATSRGSWSGSYGSGMILVYRRPYIWDHVLASLPTKISFSPFYVEFSDSWYAENSPKISMEYDEQGRLAEVCKRGFASKSSIVMKSLRH